MERVPFGIQRLDATVGGGAPAGSAVLSGLARGDAALFDLHYGSFAPEAIRASESSALRPGSWSRQ